MAARDSFFGTTASLVSSHDRSPRGAERPLAADADEIDAARRILGLQRRAGSP